MLIFLYCNQFIRLWFISKFMNLWEVFFPSAKISILVRPCILLCPPRHLSCWGCLWFPAQSISWKWFAAGSLRSSAPGSPGPWGWQTRRSFCFWCWSTRGLEGRWSYQLSLRWSPGEKREKEGDGCKNATETVLHRLSMTLKKQNR